ISGGAEVLWLDPGEERPGIDFVVRTDPRNLRPFSVGMINPFGRVPTPQPGAPATSTIRGRVLGTDGRRVSYADVRLVSETDPRAMLLTRADAEGQYAFGNLPSGVFRLAASAAGYAPGASGEIGTPLDLRLGRVIELNDAQARDRIDLTLARWSTFTGRVVDENGEPVE